MIVFDQVSKTYPGDVKAIQELSFEVKEGEILVLLGTSGSGKTTAMKMVNRLVEPTSGTILVEGEEIGKHDPIALRRKIGYAVQHVGLFPHMSVAENIAVVPSLLGWSKDKIGSRVTEMLEMVGLDPGEFSTRSSDQLSGGQKQRVGVARALAADPPIALMDEPFGALDPITREELQDAFLELQRLIKKTILFVTHDVFEAVKLGDRIALLDKGRLQQLASPVELLNKPANDFVEQFLGRQRFHLSLSTRTIGDVIHDSPQMIDEEPEVYGKALGCLSVKDSLSEAMEKYKSTKAESLPVHDGDGYLTDLNRDDLMSVVFGSKLKKKDV